MNTSIAKRATRGAFFQILTGIGQTIVRLGASAVLARQLDPKDFGIFGMALLYYNMIQTLSASGMTSGIIAKYSPTKEDLSTCFWMLMAIRILLFIFCILIAPWISIFMETPEVKQVLIVTSTMFLVTALSTIPQTLLQKKLKFGVLSSIQFICVVFESGLALYFVLILSLDYWSLVLAMLFSSVLSTLLIISFSRWFPIFCFSKSSYKYLFKYGINNMGASIMGYLGQNVDYLIVGKLLGPHIFGLYEFAFRIPHLIFERIAQPTIAVVFPALSKYQGDDKALKKNFFNATRSILVITLPCLGGLLILAPYFIDLLWGEKWVIIVNPLRILCLYSAVIVCFLYSGMVFLCKERPDLLFKISVVRFLFSVLSVSIFGFFFKLNGVAFGMLLSTIISPVYCHIACKLIGTDIFSFIRKISPPIVVTLCMMLSVKTVEIFLKYLSINDYAMFVSLISFGVMTYILLFRFLFVNEFNRNLKMIISLMSK